MSDEYKIIDDTKEFYDSGNVNNSIKSDDSVSLDLEDLVIDNLMDKVVGITEDDVEVSFEFENLMDNTGVTDLSDVTDNLAKLEDVVDFNMFDDFDLDSATVKNKIKVSEVMEIANNFKEDFAEFDVVIDRGKGSGRVRDVLKSKLREMTVDQLTKDFVQFISLDKSIMSSIESKKIVSEQSLAEWYIEYLNKTGRLITKEVDVKTILNMKTPPVSDFDRIVSVIRDFNRSKELSDSDKKVKFKDLIKDEVAAIKATLDKLELISSDIYCITRIDSYDDEFDLDYFKFYVTDDTGLEIPVTGNFNEMPIRIASIRYNNSDRSETRRFVFPEVYSVDINGDSKFAMLSYDDITKLRNKYSDSSQDSKKIDENVLVSSVSSNVLHSSELKLGIKFVNNKRAVSKEGSLDYMEAQYRKGKLEGHVRDIFNADVSSKLNYDSFGLSKESLTILSLLRDKLNRLGTEHLVDSAVSVLSNSSPVKEAAVIYDMMTYLRNNKLMLEKGLYILQNLDKYSANMDKSDIQNLFTEVKMLVAVRGGYNFNLDDLSCSSNLVSIENSIDWVEQEVNRYDSAINKITYSLIDNTKLLFGEYRLSQSATINDSYSYVIPYMMNDNMLNSIVADIVKYILINESKKELLSVYGTVYKDKVSYDDIKFFCKMKNLDTSAKHVNAIANYYFKIPNKSDSSVASQLSTLNKYWNSEYKNISEQIGILYKVCNMVREKRLADAAYYANILDFNVIKPYLPCYEEVETQLGKLRSLGKFDNDVDRIEYYLTGLNFSRAEIEDFVRTESLLREGNISDSFKGYQVYRTLDSEGKLESLASYRNSYSTKKPYRPLHGWDFLLDNIEIRVVLNKLSFKMLSLDSGVSGSDYKLERFKDLLFDKAVESGAAILPTNQLRSVMTLMTLPYTLVDGKLSYVGTASVLNVYNPLSKSDTLGSKITKFYTKKFDILDKEPAKLLDGLVLTKDFNLNKATLNSTFQGIVGEQEVIDIDITYDGFGAFNEEYVDDDGYRFNHLLEAVFDLITPNNSRDILDVVVDFASKCHKLDSSYTKTITDIVVGALDNNPFSGGLTKSDVERALSVVGN